MTTAPSTHRVVRIVDESGYVGSCPCGWRTRRRTRELREQDSHAHELEDSLTVRHDAAQGH